MARLIKETVYLQGPTGRFALLAGTREADIPGWANGKFGDHVWIDEGTEGAPEARESETTDTATTDAATAEGGEDTETKTSRKSSKAKAEGE